MDKEIVKLYSKGFDPQYIAKYFNCHHKKIRKILRENGIVLRTNLESNLLNKIRNQKDVKINKQLLNYLDGLIISDGSYSRRGHGTNFRQVSVSEDWILEISNIFDKNDIKHSIGEDKRLKYKAPCKTITTQNYLILNDQYSRWYKDGIKIVPKDLELTPTLCRNWMLGDGGYYGSGIRLCCESFTIEDNIWLIQKFREIGIICKRSKGNRITMNRKEAEKFLHYCVKESNPPKSLEYKWIIGKGRNRIKCY